MIDRYILDLRKDVTVFEFGAGSNCLAYFENTTGDTALKVLNAIKNIYFFDKGFGKKGKKSNRQNLWSLKELKIIINFLIEKTFDNKRWEHFRPESNRLNSKFLHFTRNCRFVDNFDLFNIKNFEFKDIVAEVIVLKNVLHFYDANKIQNFMADIYSNCNEKTRIFIHQYTLEDTVKFPNCNWKDYKIYDTVQTNKNFLIGDKFEIDLTKEPDTFETPGCLPSVFVLKIIPNI